MYFNDTKKMGKDKDDPRKGEPLIEKNIHQENGLLNGPHSEMSTPR